MEQPRHRRLGVGQRLDAIADVAHGRHAHPRAQLAGRTAVVGHGHDRGDVAGQLLEPAQEHRQARATADGHDVRAPGAHATLVEHLHQRLLADLVGLDQHAQDAPPAVAEKDQTDQDQAGDANLERQELQGEDVDGGIGATLRSPTRVRKRAG